MLDIPCCVLHAFPIKRQYGILTKLIPVFFVKMDKAFDPVEIVHRLCSEAQANPENKRSRWIRRLTPISLVRKILGGGLEELAREVLKPHFHSGGPSRKVGRLLAEHFEPCNSLHLLPHPVRNSTNNKE